MTTNASSTPSSSPQSNAAPQGAPAPQAKQEFMAIGDSLEEFCVSVAEALLQKGLIDVVVKETSTYGTFKLGDGPSAFRTKAPLTPEQSRRLPTSKGIPMDLAFSVALLDITVPTAVQAKRQERVAATATKTNRMLDEINRVRAANNLPAISLDK